MCLSIDHEREGVEGVIVLCLAREERASHSPTTSTVGMQRDFYFVEIEHDQKFDEEANKMSHAEHMRTHAWNLGDAKEMRPLCQLLPGFGEYLTAYWVRKSKPKQACRVYCNRCGGVFALQANLDPDRERFCHTCPGNQHHARALFSVTNFVSATTPTIPAFPATATIPAGTATPTVPATAAFPMATSIPASPAPRRPMVTSTPASPAKSRRVTNSTIPVEDDWGFDSLG